MMGYVLHTVDDQRAADVYAPCLLLSRPQAVRELSVKELECKFHRLTEIIAAQYSNDTSTHLETRASSSTADQWSGATTEILSTTTNYRIDAYTDHAITIAETDVLFRVASVQRGNDNSSSTSYFTSNYRVPDAAAISREASDPVAISKLSASCESAAVAYSANLSTNANNYTPPAGCCSALSPCFMSAADVRVFYWPNTATTNFSQGITKAPSFMTMVSEGYT